MRYNSGNPVSLLVCMCVVYMGCVYVGETGPSKSQWASSLLSHAVFITVQGNIPHLIEQLCFWSNRSQASSMGLSIHCKHSAGSCDHAWMVSPYWRSSYCFHFHASMPALLVTDLTVTLPSGKPQKWNMVSQALIHWSNCHLCRSSHWNHQFYSHDWRSYQKIEATGFF